MRKYLFLVVCAVTLFSVIGCDSGTAKKPRRGKISLTKTPPPPPPPPRITITLAELLKKPRAELAKLSDEVLEDMRSKEQSHIEEGGGFALAPEIRLPLFVPVFAEAKFSKDAGISLPPYLPEGTSDSVLALHLARHGDTEAALKLVDPADMAVASTIQGLKAEQNFPLEWTRLVGLMLHDAQYSLANGNIEGARELLKIHAQLADLNSDRFPSGLRTALLPRGKALLKKAAHVWRTGDNADIAVTINSHLVKWPNTQPPSNLAPRTARDVVCRFLGTEASGRAVLASHPLRGLDLLALPLPAEGVEAVTAFFDGYERLQEIFITYATLPPNYDAAQQLGQHIEDWQAAKVESKASPRCQYTLGDVSCEMQLTGRNPAVAAVVRLTPKEPMPSGITLPRDFGAIHLSGTFERNRASAALHERAPRMVLSKAVALEKITNPVPVLPLDHVVLARHATEDVIDELSFEFARPAKGPNTLAKIAQPLFEKLGAPSLRINKQDVVLQWEDAETRALLSVPDQAMKPVRFTAVDVAVAKERHKRARAWDLAERKQRIEANAPLTRLPRELDGVALGMTRMQVSEAVEKLPGGQRLEIVGYEKFLWSGKQANPAAPVLRELFVHYDKAGKADGLRVRYAFGPRLSPDMLLAPIRTKAGAPQPLPLRASAVWAELTPQPSPVLQQWQDDVTLVNCRRDENDLEISIRDYPSQDADAVPLPKLAYLTRGPERCALGSTRKELLDSWGIRTPTLVNGAVLVSPPQSPYDAVLIWFSTDKKDERAARIVARHRPGTRKLTDTSQASQAVRETWAKHINEYGWPWRQDLLPGNLLQSWGHHDDHTRVRIFWQDSNQGRQIFTEWMNVAQ